MDDAAAAFWLPLADLRRDHFHDDHYYLIRDNLCAQSA
jgi:bifunctional NMN adenylyltransferase/nudix hydrolase